MFGPHSGARSQQREIVVVAVAGHVVQCLIPEFDLASQILDTYDDRADGDHRPILSPLRRGWGVLPRPMYTPPPDLDRKRTVTARPVN